jgi:hypothetical protein
MLSGKVGNGVNLGDLAVFPMRIGPAYRRYSPLIHLEIFIGKFMYY